MKRKIAAFILAVLVLISIVPVGVQSVEAANTDQFSVGLQQGYDNELEVREYAPFYVRVTNNGKDFNGYLRLLLPSRGTYGQDSTIMWQKELNIPAGSTKQVVFVARPEVNTDKVGIQFVNKKDKIVETHAEQVNFSNSRYYARVGVLSDDMNALNYLSGAPFVGEPQIKTRLVKLSAGMIAENVGALDLLDAIIISDFSTDSLSEKQIRVISEWVQDGGLLILGTGSTGNKTLSGFSEYGISLGELKQVETDFGCSSIVRQYAYSDDLFNMNHNYGGVDESLINGFYESFDWSRYSEADLKALVGNPNDEVVEEDYWLTEYNGQLVRIGNFANDFYDDNEYKFVSYFWQWQYGDVKTEMEKWYSREDIRNFEESFKDYCMNRVFPDLLIRRLSDFDTMVNDNPDIVFEKVQANIREINYGSSWMPAEDYDFAKSQPVGQGRVIVLATDVTKEPFNDYVNAKGILIHLIEQFTGSDIASKIQEKNGYAHYYSNNDYTYIYRYSGVQKPVPMIAYVLLFCAYVIGVFVYYNRLKKLGKTMQYWKILAIGALGTAVIVFALSFTTRVLTMSARTTKIVNLDGEYTDEKIMTTIVTPKNKQYSVKFTKNLNPVYIGSDNYVNQDSYYYGTYYVSLNDNDKIFNSYKIGYADNVDSNEILIGSGTALGRVYFSATDHYKKEMDVVAKDLAYHYETGSLTGTITNNYGKDIKSAAVVIDCAIIPIGDFAAGQTIDLSEYSSVAMLPYRYSIYSESSKVMFGADNFFPKLLLGNGYNKTMRRNLAKYEFNRQVSDIRGLSYSSRNYVPNYNYTAGETEWLYAAEFTEEGYAKELWSSPLFLGYCEGSDTVVLDAKELNTEIIYKHFECVQ